MDEWRSAILLMEMC